MLTTGIFPDKLKIAKIIPPHKKDEETLFTNYRPISLLPALSKIFERLSLNNYIIKKKKTSCCIMHNMDSKLITLHNLLL